MVVSRQKLVLPNSLSPIIGQQIREKGGCPASSETHEATNCVFYTTANAVCNAGQHKTLKGKCFLSSSACMRDTCDWLVLRRSIISESISSLLLREHREFCSLLWIFSHAWIQTRDLRTLGYCTYRSQMCHCKLQKRENLKKCKTVIYKNGLLYEQKNSASCLTLLAGKKEKSLYHLHI